MIDHSPRHRFYGTTITEWIRTVIDEVELDAVSLDSIVGTLRTDFEMSGSVLCEAVRTSLAVLMRAGARPIQGHNDNGDCYWTRATRLGDEPDRIVEGIVAEWMAAGVDPDMGDVWFGSPRLIETECRS